MPIAQSMSGSSSTIGEPDIDVRLIGGLPDPALFPRTEWLRHYRAALNGVPNQHLGYPGPLGTLSLREALANYIARVRGVATTPDHVLITSGLTQAVVLVARALRSRGVDAIAVEDPLLRLSPGSRIQRGITSVADSR